MSSLSYSPDGTQLITGSGDKTARVWSLTRRPRCIATLHGHAAWVRSVAFSPDGMHLATGSEGKTAKIWSVCSSATHLSAEGQIGDADSSIARASVGGDSIVSGLESSQGGGSGAFDSKDSIGKQLEAFKAKLGY